MPIVKDEPSNEMAREITYLSSPAPVSMADRWFSIASLDHFWVRRRFEVLQQLAGQLIRASHEVAEIGCGHGLLQRAIEESYGREVAGFDLNEFALHGNLSLSSELYCYDIYARNAALRERFDLLLLFDVLEHIADEDGFLSAAKFHLSAGGRLVVNVPAGQWAFSAYDKAAGHVRRYSIRDLKYAAGRSGFNVTRWTYWGLPLIPSLLLRKMWLLGHHDQDEIISSGFDPRSRTINTLLRAVSRCEPIPQNLLGTSLMAVLDTGADQN
jgi:SAM-dependent methyltransferase